MSVLGRLLFGIAWLPQLLNQWIARLLLRKKNISGKQQMQIIEWIHFYPLKKLLVLGLWGFGVLLVMRGISGNRNRRNPYGWRAFAACTIIAASGCEPVSKMKRYVCMPCHNIPVLNQLLSKDQ